MKRKIYLIIAIIGALGMFFLFILSIFIDNSISREQCVLLKGSPEIAEYFKLSEELDRIKFDRSVRIFSYITLKEAREKIKQYDEELQITTKKLDDFKVNYPDYESYESFLKDQQNKIMSHGFNRIHGSFSIFLLPLFIFTTIFFFLFAQTFDDK